MKIRKINESNDLNLDLIKNIDDLIDNLDYLKKFVSRFKEDDIQFPAFKLESGILKRGGNIIKFTYVWKSLRNLRTIGQSSLVPI